uniref:G_PROTEIN_RECEP_F2_4 domain-containing protein n=2 Tax=Macrostomum lignano TaxID=282301 RepID=A0A1I8IK20_9PLAT
LAGAVAASSPTEAEEELRRQEAACSVQTVRSAAFRLLAALDGGSASSSRRRFCPAAFDGFACWPRTPAGAEARVPCPTPVFESGGFAWRRCQPDGRWEFPASAASPAVASALRNSTASMVIGSSYSNYSACRSKESFDYLAKRLQVTKVSKMLQYKRLELENRTCQALIEDAMAANATGCLPTFDNAICWPGVPAGTRVYMSCPDYVNELNRRGFAWRRCLGNGSWHRPAGKPGRGEGWTNFTACSVSDPPSTALVSGWAGLGAANYRARLWCRLRRLHCQKNFIHINLFLAFSLKAVSHFLNYFASVENMVVICRSHQTLLTYSVIASFTWVFVEALHLYMLIFVNTMSGSKMRSMPLHRHLGGAAAPAGQSGVLAQVNAGLFARIVRELFVKMRNQPLSSAATQNYRKLWKSTSVLVIVFGIYYLIFLPLSVIPKDKLGATLDYIKLAYEHFFNSFQKRSSAKLPVSNTKWAGFAQKDGDVELGRDPNLHGFFVSLLFCFVNSDVLKELKRHLLETKLGRRLKRRGFIRPPQDVYGLEPETRRANRRARARASNGPPHSLPFPASAFSYLTSDDYVRTMST